MAEVALVTGPITGRIPTPDKAIDGDFTDVTPDVLVFSDVKQAEAVAAAIEVEHYTRGSHPVQVQCAELDAQPDITDEERAQHRKLHTQVKKRVGA